MMNTVMRFLDASRRMFVLTVVGATSFAFCSVGAAPLTFSASSAVTISGSEKITVLCGGLVRSTGSGAVTISAPIQAGETAGESASTSRDPVS